MRFANLSFKCFELVGNIFTLKYVAHFKGFVYSNPEKSHVGLSEVIQNLINVGSVLHK